MKERKKRTLLERPPADRDKKKKRFQKDGKYRKAEK